MISKTTARGPGAALETTPLSRIRILCSTNQINATQLLCGVLRFWGRNRIWNHRHVSLK